MTARAKIGAMRLVMFCNFFVNRKNLAFRVVNYLDVRAYTWAACINCNLLAVCNDFHKLAVEAGAFYISDNLVYDSDEFVLVRNFR